MNIQGAATATNLTVKTVRYYEAAGLVAPTRAANGYRDFDAGDLARLSFIARARRLSFSMDEIRTLISLQDNPARRSAEVKTLALDHLKKLDQRLAELQQMRSDLQAMADACPGDDGANCAILDGLSQKGL